MSNPLVHAGINTLLYVPLSLALSVPLAWENWLLIVLFGTIFDLDHVPYFLRHTRPFTFQNLKDNLKVDYTGQVPHFYVCHTIEFESFLIIACVLFWNQLWGLWVMLGWSVHLVTDALTYCIHYKSFTPWVQFWSCIYIASKRRNTS